MDFEKFLIDTDINSSSLAEIIFSKSFPRWLDASFDPARGEKKKIPGHKYKVAISLALTRGSLITPARSRPRR